MREKGKRERERETEMNIRESTKSVYSSIGKNSSVNVAELAIRGYRTRGIEAQKYTRDDPNYFTDSRTRRSSEGVKDEKTRRGRQEAGRLAHKKAGSTRGRDTPRRDKSAFN